MHKSKSNLIPVHIITGFLGSGKTSLIKKLMKYKLIKNAAIIVNEFGEVGIDHHLVEAVDENMVMLQSGCICCTIREDLTTTLIDLWEKKSENKIKFETVVIETTGLADPSPIIYSLMTYDKIKYHFSLGNIITIIDVINGLNNLSKQQESIKQLAVADKVIISKTDISKTKLDILKNKIKLINPSAKILLSADKISPIKIFTNDLYNLNTKHQDVIAWINDEALKNNEKHVHNRNRHNESIYSFCLYFNESLDWTVFGIWLTMLLNKYGQLILRIKGLLNVKDVKGPVAIHGVQHMIYPPVHLGSWPDNDKRSKIVFIVDSMDKEKIQKSLKIFNSIKTI
ncbi:GTP-binding protein [Alphaproteobacteria bacterium]|nr:GTP-binding protein [Alphaproteobacteria bacterium]|tara:strand:- start:76 stop:1098 length:1023 start_codon:yes stop_codon:yes gene_type:complete